MHSIQSTMSRIPNPSMHRHIKMQKYTHYNVMSLRNEVADFKALSLPFFASHRQHLTLTAQLTCKIPSENNYSQPTSHTHARPKNEGWLFVIVLCGGIPGMIHTEPSFWSHQCNAPLEVTLVEQWCFRKLLNRPRWHPDLLSALYYCCCT